MRFLITFIIMNLLLSSCGTDIFTSPDGDISPDGDSSTDGDTNNDGDIESDGDLTPDGDKDDSDVEDLTLDGDQSTDDDYDFSDEPLVQLEEEFDLDQNFDLTGEFSINEIAYSTKLLKITWLDENDTVLQIHEGSIPLNSFGSPNIIELKQAPLNFTKIELTFDIIFIRGGGDVSGKEMIESIRGGGDVSGIIITHLVIDRTSGEWKSVLMQTAISSDIDLFDYNSSNRERIAEEFIRNFKVIENNQVVGKGNYTESEQKFAVYPATETGQKKCYNINGFEIDCTGAGQDGENQKQWDLDLIEDAIELTNADGHYDPLTKLIWEQMQSQYNQLTFENANNYCNGMGMRLPTKLEFRTVFNFGNDNVREGIYMDTGDYFWTSDKFNETRYWGFNKNTGTNLTIAEDDTANVYCVMGPKFSDVSKEIYNNVDNMTGLSWHIAPYTMGWQVALNYCNDLTVLGASDWRMANIAELSLTVDRGVTQYGNIYWSSTSYVPDAESAWCLDDSSWGAFQKIQTYNVACVRNIP